MLFVIFDMSRFFKKSNNTIIHFLSQCSTPLGFRKIFVIDFMCFYY